MMKDDIEFRFRGAGMYGDHFYNQFWLDEQGEYHRDDGPAIKYGGGGEVWMQHGKAHRDGDLPAVTNADGDQAWCKNGSFHREGKPAVIYAGGAVEWWENGRQLSAQEVEALLAAQARTDLEKRGGEVAEALRRNRHGQVTAPKTAKFSR